MLDNEGRALVESLAAAHVEPPTRSGDELGQAAIPADLIWDEPRIAVLMQATDDDVAELRAEGWTVVPAQTDAVSAALKEADGAA